MSVYDYRIPFTPLSVFAHSPRGDMLAGHLCWYFAQADGAMGAQRLIQAANDGAFRLSDVFPEGFLPLPMDDPQVCQKEWRIAEEAFYQAVQKRGDKDIARAKSNWYAIRKRARKLTFVDARCWHAGVSRPKLLQQLIEDKILAAMLLPRLQLPWSPIAERAGTLPARLYSCQGDCGATNRFKEEWNSLHTAVNRVSNGALDGSLHERVGIQYKPGCRMDLYLRCDEGELGKYMSALEQIGLDGHLKHSSTGWGRFSLGKPEPWTPPTSPVDISPGRAGVSPGCAGVSPGCAGVSPGRAGVSPGCAGVSPGCAGVSPGCAGVSPASTHLRWVSLSPCIPEEDYSGEACYKLLPHYGKLGGAQTESSVYKRPVILLATGAAFTVVAPRGCWLRHVHSTQPEVLHYAFAYLLEC